MVKVLIVDDRELTRQSLQTVLSSRPDIAVTDVASNGQGVIRSVRKNKPDVILVDIRMPKLDGAQCTEIIKGSYPQIKIIILTMFDDDEYVHNALKYSVSGYLLKGVSTGELADVIITVCSGWVTISPGTATKVLRLFSQMVQIDYSILVGDKNVDELIRIEWEIIAQMEVGASNRKIAETLKLFEGMVRNYLNTTLNKLDLRDHTQLAIWAIRTNVRKRLDMRDLTGPMYGDRERSRYQQKGG